MCRTSLKCGCQVGRQGDIQSHTSIDKYQFSQTMYAFIFFLEWLHITSVEQTEYLLTRNSQYFTSQQSFSDFNNLITI